jgi:beta-lactamase class A
VTVCPAASTPPGIEAADKPGALDHLRSDVGIVCAKSAPIAIAISCEDIPKPDWSPANP